MTPGPVEPDGIDLPAHAFGIYAPELKSACLRLLDANCPAFFAPNERKDYAAFLDRAAPGYFTMQESGEVVAAFGLSDGSVPDRGRLTWIMVHPDRQKGGLGRRIMAAVSALGRAAGITAVDIAASHHSAPFFALHGARIMSATPNGWGPGMHRIDMELLLVNRD